MSLSTTIIDALNKACPALGSEYGNAMGTFLAADSIKLTSVETTLDTASTKLTSIETTLNSVSVEVTGGAYPGTSTHLTSVEATVATLSAKATSIEATADAKLALAGGTLTGFLDFAASQMFSVVFSGTSNSIINTSITAGTFAFFIPLDSGGGTMMQANPAPYISARGVGSMIVTHSDDNGEFGVVLIR